MKLYLVLLGAETPGRVVEQHDYFFGIAESLVALVPDIRAFWPEAGVSLHIDGWREVNQVDGYAVQVADLADKRKNHTPGLFFLNLGGYTTGKLEEQHYTVLTVQESRLKAVQAAKHNLFFKTNSLKGTATAHIDEKYGVDVDSIHHIEDLISPELKAKYRIVLQSGTHVAEDKIHLGYLKLDKIK